MVSLSSPGVDPSAPPRGGAPPAPGVRLVRRRARRPRPLPRPRRRPRPRPRGVHRGGRPGDGRRGAGARRRRRRRAVRPGVGPRRRRPRCCSGAGTPPCSRRTTASSACWPGSGRAPTASSPPAAWPPTSAASCCSRARRPSSPTPTATCASSPPATSAWPPPAPATCCPASSAPSSPPACRPLDAAASAAWIHGEAARRRPAVGLVAGDLVDALPDVLGQPRRASYRRGACRRAVGVGRDRPRRRGPQRRRAAAGRGAGRRVGRRQGRRLRPRRGAGRPGGARRRVRRAVRRPHRRGRGAARGRDHGADPRAVRAAARARRRVVAHQLTPTVTTPAGIDALAGPRPAAGLGVHLKVDTGMHRVGAAPADVPDLAAAIAGRRGLRLAGVFTHLAVADEPDDPYTAGQLARFDEVLADLPPGTLDASPSTPPTRPAPSPSRRPGGRSCGPGIALYGISPGPGVDDRCADLRPVMALKARVSFVKRLGAGERLSYGLRHTLAADANVATVPIGYADGVRRGLSSRGRRADRRPAAADHRRDHDGPADGRLRRRRRRGRRRGRADRRPGRRADPAEEWAGALGTIGYEITCGISRRVPRRWRVNSTRPVMAPSPRLELRAPSLDDTHAIAGALAALARPGDVILLAGEMGTGKTAFAQGFGRALGVDRADHVADVHARAQLRHRRRDAAPRRPVPPRAPGRGRRPGARRAGRVRRHRARRVGRRRRVDVRRPPPRRASAPVADDVDARTVTVAADRAERGLRRWAALGGGHEGAARADPRHRDGHRAGQRGPRRARGRDRAVRDGPRAVATPRCSRRPSTSCAPRPTSVSTSSASSPSTSVPGLFTGMRVGLAAAKALALALRLPMIGISSLDLLAFPHRRSDRVVVPVIDARKGEVFYAMYRPGAGRRAAGRRAACRAGRRARRRPAGPQPGGAVRRRRRAALPDRDPRRLPLRDRRRRPPVGGPLVQLAHARALREEWVSPAEIRPIYLRQPDAQINWATPGHRPLGDRNADERRSPGCSTGRPGADR